MEDGVSIRYYRVGRAEPGHPMLGDQLRAILALGPPGARMKEVNGVKIRLERCVETAAGHFEGEFIRLQEKGYPSEVDADGVAKLATDKPLGHHLAFIYNMQKSILATEHDLRSLSLGRINDYLSRFPPHNFYLFTPLMRDDAWARFNSAPTRKVQFAIAGARDLHAVEQQGKAVFQELGSIAGRYNPHIIEVSLSMGHTKGRLDKAKELIESLILGDQNGEFDLRSLKAVPAPAPGEDADEINFLNELLTERINLDLPRNDPEQSYQMRMGALQEGYKRNERRFK